MAQASLCEWRTTTEIEGGFLAAKVERKQKKRRAKSQKAKSSRLELLGDMGMSSFQSKSSREKNIEFSQKPLTSVELFAGAGGMALGVARAGFHHQAVIELNGQACATIKRNQNTRHSLSVNWPLFESDVSSFNYSNIRGSVDLLAGGPPCQPFSLAGKHKGMKDERNMFPEVFRAVRELQPKAVLLENVRGLGRSSFSEYFDYLVAHLENPEIERKKSESWDNHYARIVRNSKISSSHRLQYQVFRRVVNAADFGIPQCRERVFIVALRADLNLDWSFPEATHSFESLMRDQWITGTYWDKYGIGSRSRPSPTEKQLNKVESLFERGLKFKTRSWQTVRDAIHDLPNPTILDTGIVENHHHNPGARSYVGHTGSQFDLPAKTLKAGSHGVPGGENMLAHSNGKVRYFTVRECARLQTFPDNYIFPDVWCTAMKQIGNAVPVKLAEVMAKSIATAIREQLQTKECKKSRSWVLNKELMR